MALLPANQTRLQHLHSRKNQFLDAVSRFNYDVYDIMQTIHNFHIFDMYTTSWGYRKNGTWYGAIGFIVRDEVDFSVSSVRYVIERFGIFDVTQRTYDAR